MSVSAITDMFYTAKEKRLLSSLRMRVESEMGPARRAMFNELVRDVCVAALVASRKRNPECRELQAKLREQCK